MFRRLVYVSRPQEDLALTEVPKIVAVCRARNMVNGITGVLLFTGTEFAQLIEGPLDPMNELWSRIRSDPRHRDIAVVLDECVTERWYNDWRIGYPTDSTITTQISSWRDYNRALNEGQQGALRQLFAACDAV